MGWQKVEIDRNLQNENVLLNTLNHFIEILNAPNSPTDGFFLPWSPSANYYGMQNVKMIALLNF